MTRWNTADIFHPGESGLASRSLAGIAILALAAALPGFIVIWLMSAPLSLAAVGLAWLVNAGSAALLAWYSRAKRRTHYINLWDVAGAYAFVGFAAAILSEQHEILHLFGLAMPAR